MSFSLQETQTYKATTEYRSDKFEKALLEESFKYVDFTDDAKRLSIINQITSQTTDNDKNRALNTYLKVLDNMSLNTAGKIYTFMHKNTNPEIDSLTKNLTTMRTGSLNTQYYDEATRDLTWFSYPIKLSQSEYDNRLQRVALSVLTTNFIKNKVNNALYNELKKDFQSQLDSSLEKSFLGVFKQDLNYQNVLNDEYIKANQNIDITKFEKTVTDLKIELFNLRLKPKDILINGTKYNFQFKEEDFEKFNTPLRTSSEFIENFKKKQFINSFNLHVEEALKDLNPLLKEFNFNNTNWFIDLKKTILSKTVFWGNIDAYLQKNTKININAFREKLVYLYLKHLEVKEKGVTLTDKEIYQVKLPEEETQRQEKIINFLTELAIHLKDEKKLENYTEIENTKNPHLSKPYIQHDLKEYRTQSLSINNLQEAINTIQKDETYLKKLEIINAYAALIYHISSQENFDTLAAAEKRYTEVVNLSIVVKHEDPNENLYRNDDLKRIITQEHVKIKNKTLADYNVMLNNLKGELKDHFKTQKTKLEKEIKPNQETIVALIKQIEDLKKQQLDKEKLLGPLII
jgi:hypothetical protein